MRLDGQVVGTFSVAETSFTNFEVEVQINAGVREIAVGFTNDYYDQATSEDRNLLVDSFSLEGPLDVSAEPNPLREQLVQNQRQLARILYELGRGYVLAGMLPGFSRLVAREPVPIPDMSMRGRNLVDEVARLTAGDTGVEWVRAKELFAGGEFRTVDLPLGPSRPLARRR